MKETKEALLSACMDGHLSAGKEREILAAIENDPELRARWMRYHMISDTLQNHLPDASDTGFPARVSLALESEPAILAPQATRRNYLKPAAGLAIAASVALVAVLSLQQSQPDKSFQLQPAQQVASVDAPQAPASLQVMVAEPGIHWDTRKPTVETRLNSYLVNHNERVSYGMQGMPPYIRIVGYDANR